MEILIIGIGQVGYHLAETLAKAGHSVTVLDPSESAIRNVQESLDVQAIQGDATHPATLDAAEAGLCDLVLGVSDSDQVNMLGTLMARRMGAKHSILRVKDKTHYQSYAKFLRSNLLFDEILSLEDLAAEAIAKIVRRNQAVEVENFLGGQVTLRVVPVDDASPLNGRALRDCARQLHGALVVAVRRDHGTLIPGGETEFLEGDKVYLLGKPGNVEHAEAWVGHHKGRARNIVIFGGSNVALQAAKQLEMQGLRPRLLAPSDKIKSFAEEAPITQVLRVDGVEKRVFMEQHVGKADAFVAASDSDETNLLTCQLAKHLGCDRTIALVSRPDYADLHEVVGITAAISPRELCANAIVQHVQAGKLRHLAAFYGGEAKVCSANIAHGSAWIGRQVKDLGLPKSCVIGAVKRRVDGNDTVLIPRGDDVLFEDDDVILFLLSNIEKQVYELVSAKS